MVAEIRAATVADIPALLGLAKRMHAESPRFARRTFVPGKCEAVIRALLTGQVAGSVFVAEKNHAIVGMAAGFVVEHFFGDEKTASDLAVYVTPEERGGSIAIKLIRAFEHAVRAAGAVELTLGISTEIAAERTVDLYERLGYRRSGYSMLKELHPNV